MLKSEAVTLGRRGEEEKNELPEAVSSWKGSPQAVSVTPTRVRAMCCHHPTAAADCYSWLEIEIPLLLGCCSGGDLSGLPSLVKTGRSQGWLAWWTQAVLGWGAFR